MVYMIRVNVSITNISAERFRDARTPIPPVQINTNISLVTMEKKKEDFLEVPFILTVNYHPSIAQISLKGKASVTGDKGEIDKIHKDYKGKKPPSPVIVQSISNVVFVESVLISKTLNIPPPIPLPKIPIKKHPEKSPSRLEYTT
jgi:hypothetical protein